MGTFDAEWKCPVCGTPLTLATDGKLHASYQLGCRATAIGITRIEKRDEDGVIREYVPCKRNSDGAQGYVCPETEDFICADEINKYLDRLFRPAEGESSVQLAEEESWGQKKIREYVPCQIDDDGAEGYICPETGDSIYIRPAREGE